MYGVGISIVHENAACAGIFIAAAREDLNQDGVPELLHPRFGFVDMFNLDVKDARERGTFSTGQLVRPTDDCQPGVTLCGPWANFDGFAIDHGPMLIMIDNYLEHNFVPHLFMSAQNIKERVPEIVSGAANGFRRLARWIAIEQR